MDIPVGWQDVAHDDKVDLLSMRELDTVETKEAAQEGVRVLFDVLMWQWIAKMNVSQGAIGSSWAWGIVFPAVLVTHVKVLFQDLSHELVLGMGDGLDNESIVL